MSVKKIVLFVFIIIIISFTLICFFHPNYRGKIDTIKVTQVYYDIFYNEEINVVLYEGKEEGLENLVNMIKRSKTTNNVIKTKFSEGDFFVEFFNSDNQKILSYDFFNYRNAFDQISGKGKKTQDVRDYIPNIIGKGKDLRLSEESTREDFYVNVSETVLRNIFVDEIRDVNNFVYTEKTIFIEKPFKKNLSDYLSSADYGKEIKIVETTKKDKVVYLFFILNGDEWICFSSLEC